MSFYYLPSPSLREWLLWLLGRRHRFRIMGDSMSPTLKAGDMVLVQHHAYNTHAPCIGDVVIAQHPYQKTVIVKRVVALKAKGYIILHGDNAFAGTDSRQWGALSPEHILGKVTCHLNPLL